jgi:hypothetical protein
MLPPLLKVKHNPGTKVRNGPGTKSLKTKSLVLRVERVALNYLPLMLTLSLVSLPRLFLFSFMLTVIFSFSLVSLSRLSLSA